MNLTRFALDNRTLVSFLVTLIFFGGIFSYFQLGQLEDPDFTVKIAAIVTEYPGASPEEVEMEVTDRIETALQEMPQLRYVTSYSRAGLSIIKVEIQQEYWADRLPQVWDEMRRKVNDITPQFPPGVKQPNIMDDFSFVFGFVLAMTGDGYTYAELETYAKALRKELSLVPGVSRADLWGVQPKVVYLDVSESQLSELQITQADILNTLAQQNMVVNAGNIEVAGKRLRVEASGEFNAADEIGDLVIRRTGQGALGAAMTDVASPGMADMFNNLRERSGSQATTRDNELIQVRDVATVRSGYLEPAITQMRFNGEPALAIQLANITGGNVVETGQALDARLEELLPLLPAGIDVEKFVWQSDLVQESVGGFVVSLLQAVLIVLVVITLAMGWRMGLVIGWSLILTILGTFIVMLSLGIDLQRVSLGALVVALGMMVDNAIVVADNMAVGLSRGKKPRQAALEAASKPSLALLGATVVAVMAFFPVFFAKADSGEYAQSLFIVVAVALITSWLIAVMVTPLNCISLLKAPAPGKDADDPYASPLFKGYRGLLSGAIRFRWLTIGGLTLLLGGALIGFQGIPQQFFPDSTRAQIRIDFWAPQGTPIQEVAEVTRLIEAQLDDDPRVKNVGNFIGAGGPRFYLPVDPEFPYPEYAQLIVNTHDFADVDPLLNELEPWLNEHIPHGMVRIRKYTVGPGDDWPFELRISGPAEADLGTLRQLAEQGMAILHASPYAKDVRTDIRQPVPKVVAAYDQARARWSGISRLDMANATLRSFDGMPVGVYREGDSVIPILARNTDLERVRVSAELDMLQVQSPLGTQTLPLGAITHGFDIDWEEPVIVRHQRKRQVAIQASPDGVTFPTLRASVIEQFEAMERELPPGYSMFWDGEYNSTRTAQLSLVPGMVPAVVVMAVIIVGLFNAMRPALIIALAIPFAVIGITAILLPTQTPFGFMALLGAMSLAGLMIKNAIVLLDEIKSNLADGKAPYQATLDAGISRLRPVLLGAGTTVLGVIPLLQDAFWVSMAMTIMAGLAFGTMITMVLVPVLYATLYRIRHPAETDQQHTGV